MQLYLQKLRMIFRDLELVPLSHAVSLQGKKLFGTGTTQSTPKSKGGQVKVRLMRK